MEQLLSDAECKSIISILCRKLCARAPLVTTRLLALEDKNDLRAGNLSIEALECGIRTWIQNGMPDYANGKNDPYSSKNTSTYTKP